jgi:hypothetical protein
MYCVETKHRIFDSEFAREVAIVVGVPLGLFVALVVGYLIYDYGLINF